MVKKTNVSYALAKNENKYELPTKLKTNGGKDKVKSIELEACMWMFCTNFALVVKWYWCRFQWGCITKAALYNALFLFLPFLPPSLFHEFGAEKKFCVWRYMTKPLRLRLTHLILINYLGSYICVYVPFRANYNETETCK